MSEAADIAVRLTRVRERIAAAARRAGRTPEEITLVGAAKQKSAAQVVAAVQQGLCCVGESYAQEARQKLPEVRAALERADLKPPHWHFIGHLQANKARIVASLFDVVESVDREALGAELERRAASAGRRLSVLLQVNASGEPQKGGAGPEELPRLLAASRAWAHLDVSGLMAIPQAHADPERARPDFARLRELRASLHDERLRELSMGMSGDFEIAIEEGATIVRVGTAIFGPRQGAASQTGVE